jgi:hypothetical protein
MVERTPMCMSNMCMSNMCMYIRRTAATPSPKGQPHSLEHVS